MGYCICTAGTVHVHGAHYKGGRQEEVFSASADFLSREMQQLSELRYAWSSVQHQRDTLQTIYTCHSELVKALASNPMRYSPVFHLEDFFDRYSDLGSSFDGAHISFTDLRPDQSQEAYTGHDLYAPHGSSASMNSNPTSDPSHINSKRKQSSASRKRHLDLKIAHRNSHPESTLPTPNGTVCDERSQFSDRTPGMQHSVLESPITPFLPSSNMSAVSQSPFSPPYGFPAGQAPESYDPMFGMHNVGYSYGNSLGSTGHIGRSGTISAGQQEGMTPDARSVGEHSTGTAGTDGEKDPFLSLLETLAENEYSRGGPSELDFFLSGAQ